MTDEELMRLLHAFHQLEVQEAEKHHPLRQSSCPPPSRLMLAPRADWSEAEREHAAGCRYCQRILAQAEKEAVPHPAAGLSARAKECPVPDQQTAARSSSGLLVLSRKLGEKIVIGENISITVLDINRGKIRLGIEAPLDVPIFRQELLPLKAGDQPTTPSTSRVSH
jgi:carbon storage regulator